MKRIIKNLLFPILGLASLLWFLVRVIPKPSRAAYPCMKAAAPLASTFVVYLVGLFSSMAFLKKSKRYLLESRYVLSSFTLIAGITLAAFTFLQDTRPAKAVPMTTLEESNAPIGIAKGIKPGRVAWIHDPDATNENWENVRNNSWGLDSNTDQSVVNQMVSEALQMMTGASSDEEAWEAMFHYFNQLHGKGDVGYTAGEKFVIKVNFNAPSYIQGGTDTSPQIMYAILDQLVNVVGVAQEDIGIGDPNIDFKAMHWDKCHPDFPNVNYWGSSQGRYNVEPSADPVLFASDGGASDPLPQCYLDAAYMINLPVFKKHHRAGISLTSKNHFGSITKWNNGQGAWHWHYSLPAPDGYGDVSNGEYGAYRCFVDIMGHKDLGGKTILFMVDGLWSGTNWGHPPVKWRMEPFNNDYPNSIFASMDPVAIQSVGYDFLYEEFDPDHPTEGAYDPQDNSGPFSRYAGSNDFLRQAADPTKWPEGIQYDPEQDGTILSSMGVYEHWNNATDKQYSRDLGTGEGIELVRNFGTEVEQPIQGLPTGFTLDQNYPNPFNPSTEISYTLSKPAQVRLVVYRADGRVVRQLFSGYQEPGTYVRTWDSKSQNGNLAPSGVYLYKLFVNAQTGSYQDVHKMVLNR